MAFTDEQLTKITRITGVDSIIRDEVLAYYASEITSEDEDQVGEMILEWFPLTRTGAGRKFTRIKANDRNFGAEKNPAELRAAIRADIGKLLYLTPYMTSGSRLVRA